MEAGTVGQTAKQAQGGGANSQGHGWQVMNVDSQRKAAPLGPHVLQPQLLYSGEAFFSWCSSPL